MIHDFQLWWNTEVVFGDGAAEKLGALIKRDGATKVMVHYGSGEYLHSTGVLDTVRKSLEDAGLEYIELGGVVPNPRISLVREGIELARREGVDYMVAIGGGSAIDSAKCIAVGVFYDGDIWDVCSRDVSLAGKMKTLPVASVVTMPATGSEMGLASIIRNEDKLMKSPFSDRVMRPHFAFLNPKYTLTIPRYLMVNGICDIMSHHCDRYMTDDAHFGYFDNLLESAMHYLHSDLAPKLLDPEQDSVVERGELMAIANMGVDEWIAWGRHNEMVTHAIAHQIGALFDVIHGSTLTIVYCAWLPYVYKDNLPRVKRWAEKVWDVPADFGTDEEIALEGIRRLREWFVSLGMPVKLSDLDIHPTDEQIERMADQVLMVNKKPCNGSVKKLYKEDLIQIYKNAL